MKNKIIAFAIGSAVVASVGLTGCKKFEDTNVNPYATTTPVTQNLLTGALRSLPSVTNSAVGALYAQHIAEVQYTTTSRFADINVSYAAFYTGPLLSLQKIIDFNSDPATAPTVVDGGSNANQIAVARILKAYFFFHITNRWGDIPYSEALKQGDNLAPKFDKQQDVYTDLFKELKEAANQFDGGKIVAGDIFLGGSVNKWKAFANSLRLVMALRLSKADPAKGKAEFIDAKNAGVILTNAETYKYNHLNETANESAWYARYLTRFDYAISKPFLDYLQSVNDPRIPAFADKPTDGNANYKGMPYGLDVTTGIPNNSISYIGTNLRKQNSPEYILSAAHVLFTLAEGEKRGWNAGNAPNDVEAAKFYLDGIKASMEQYGVSGGYAAYVLQPDIVYSATDAIKQISYQRWIALYLNGFESWMEWRRTGFPTLSPGPAPLTSDGQIPRRQAYTTLERDLNLDNYKAVLQSQGPDELNTKIWIDKP
ncbi:SusD/RagB family nutrient-binding outer membrane lipoprotein [Terrimonas pollutisoli]|uniref:SusD/RagB family nutrient-binding outer membrane lipoprotein n=1 Tax=Terrimonas pollutisoli TaxID=3034147 RepID=UPI0023ECAF85|nr:SusD/RagB family nutrient-binding outer membrane lipoprotein [Terrimonas sp. H1YJ31]